MIKTDNYTLYLGSMLDVLDTIPENSIHAVVTDPPYEINFMNNGWDKSGIVFQKETWEKVYRVLKPGGHLLSFNHSRTFHRMVVAIEDAGFQIRDTIMWMYGSGFPKSHNISIAIDKKLGAEREVIGKHNQPAKSIYTQGEVEMSKDVNLTAPKTEQAKQWDGWGTALKPSYEPIIMARKPLEGTVADNVLKHGVGGINIDESRVATDELTPRNNKVGQNGTFNSSEGYVEPHDGGRFPANTIHDNSPEVTDLFPETTSSGGSFKAGDYQERDTSTNFTRGDFVGRNDSGSAARFFYTAKASKKDRDEGLDLFNDVEIKQLKNVSRFCLACGKREDYGCTCNAGFEYQKQPNYGNMRKNMHPTVKPTDLMQYLVRLVTPKGGTVLDPFMGSGSTGKAAMIENNEREAGYYFIGIDLTEEYIDIAQARIEYGVNYRENKAREQEKQIVGNDQIRFEI